jgi:hypothetical protein
MITRFGMHDEPHCGLPQTDCHRLCLVHPLYQPVVRHGPPYHGTRAQNQDTREVQIAFTCRKGRDIPDIDGIGGLRWQLPIELVWCHCLGLPCGGRGCTPAPRSSDQPHEEDEAHAQTPYPPRSHRCGNDWLPECISLLAVGAHDHCPRQRTERRRAPVRPLLHAVRGQPGVVSPTRRGRVVALRSPTSRRDVWRGWMFGASGPLDVGSLCMTPRRLTPSWPPRCWNAAHALRMAAPYRSPEARAKLTGAIRRVCERAGGVVEGVSGALYSLGPPPTPPPRRVHGRPRLPK